MSLSTFPLVSEIWLMDAGSHERVPFTLFGGWGTELNLKLNQTLELFSNRYHIVIAAAQRKIITVVGCPGSIILKKLENERTAYTVKSPLSADRYFKELLILNLSHI